MFLALNFSRLHDINVMIAPDIIIAIAQLNTVRLIYMLCSFHCANQSVKNCIARIGPTKDVCCKDFLIFILTIHASPDQSTI